MSCTIGVQACCHRQAFTQCHKDHFPIDTLVRSKLIFGARENLHMHLGRQLEAMRQVDDPCVLQSGQILREVLTV